MDLVKSKGMIIFLVVVFGITIIGANNLKKCKENIEANYSYILTTSYAR